MSRDGGPEVEIEHELKRRIASDDFVLVTKRAQSSHCIYQCYFRPSIVRFTINTDACYVVLAGIDLVFDTDQKQRNTLQAILDQTPDPIVRLRRMDNDWYFTVKGLSMDHGTLEFEVCISPNQGLALAPHSFQSLEKTRCMVREDGYLWEIDAYLGKLEGLFIAELENRQYAIFPPVSYPDWAGVDVTKDFRYKNNCLAAASQYDVTALLEEPIASGPTTNF